MLLLLLPAKFRGKINLPDKVVVYVNPLDAVAAGLVGFVDNDLVHKFMQELGSQRCRLGVLLYNFQKTSDIDSLRFGCLYNDAQTFNGPLIYDIAERGKVIAHLIVAVHSVIDGDKANAQFWKADFTDMDKTTN